MSKTEPVSSTVRKQKTFEGRLLKAKTKKRMAVELTAKMMQNPEQT